MAANTYASEAKRYIGLLFGSTSKIPSTLSAYISDDTNAYAVRSSITSFLSSSEGKKLSSAQQNSLRNIGNTFNTYEQNNTPKAQFSSPTTVFGSSVSNVPTINSTLATAQANASTQKLQDLKNQILANLNDGDPLEESIRNASSVERIGTLMNANRPSVTEVRRANAYLAATQNTFPDLATMKVFVAQRLSPDDLMRSSINNADSMDEIRRITTANSPDNVAVKAGRSIAYNTYQKAIGGATTSYISPPRFTGGSVVEAEPSQNGGYNVLPTTNPINPSADDPVNYGNQGDAPGNRPVTRLELATIISYATNQKLNGTALQSLVDEWWWRAEADGEMTFDEAAGLIAKDKTIQQIAASGSSFSTRDDINNFMGQVGQPVGVVLTSGPQVNRVYTLIRGDGAPGGSDLRSNGNAVFLVSSSGELFHVTEQLANEMKANNTWYEPSVRPQEDIKNMTLRMSLNHTAELGVLDFAPSGDYLLVKGDGPALSGSQLSGNGDAVYAIDKNGNKFHVTGEVAAQMQANNTWTTPAVLNQGTIDQAPIMGALASASGGTAPLSIPIGDSNIVTVAAGAASNILGSSNFKLVKGDGPNLGTSQLTGNGAAVYAVMPDGSKLHVTAQMAEELRKNNLWTTPEERPQAEIDRTPAIGTLSTISGGVGAFVVPVTAAGSSTTPNPNNPTPAVTAPSVAPSNNSSQSFTFIRGDGPNLGTSQLKGNGAAVYAVMPDGSMLHVTEKMYHELVAANKWSEPKVIPQWEMDSKTPSGTLSTINGGVGSFIVPLNAVPSNPIVGHLDTAGEYEDTLQSADVIPQTTEEETWSQPQNSFKLIRGDGPNLGSSQLSGNGAAVYAVMPDGSKLHVTGEMAQQLQWENKWTEPEVRPQWEVDQTPATGTLATTSGGWAPLVVPVWAPQEVAPAAAPLAPAAAPVAVAPAPVPQAAPATPINPDYHPAVYSSLNQEGSLQKQLELNMFFGAANPDIFEPLKSDLNPTGSIQKQKELNTYFASVQTNPTSGGIGGSDPNAGLMPAAVPPTQTW